MVGGDAKPWADFCRKFSLLDPPEGSDSIYYHRGHRDLEEYSEDTEVNTRMCEGPS